MLAGAVKAAGIRRNVEQTLVLLHLSGGNDGLNTVIPCGDPLYRELRPRLSRVAGESVPIGEQVALHPSLRALAQIYERGQLAIVQGAGYSTPDYSHVGSCRIWVEGLTDRNPEPDPWDAAVHRASPQLSCLSATFASVGYAPTPNPLPYSAGRIEEVLAAVTRLAETHPAPRLAFASVGGFDTHEDQLPQHAHVLRELGGGLARLQCDLERQGTADHVLVMVWSEFGRRPAENTRAGTDHGAAGPVFIMGRGIKGGLYGRTPSLAETDAGNLVATVDFRSVYAELAERWLHCLV
ncbi:MAG TPA: DUF1501 domain-containing protein [Phycisphaerae bacterium]|nr:DUF1501 domain-containing protein [Phycisphaerae bacterium]HRY70314.1 DUF1501 domain-containing protein [Phycisphaerae bacterium]HSA28031.1 DUF1501 domain-containing protein [Phycisphaerae bacterium]